MSKTQTEATQAKAAEYGAEKSKDLPWSDKKVKIFKALRSLKALTPAEAVSSKMIAEKAEVTLRDARHYCYHAKAGGLIGFATSEAFSGYGFFLTKKGQAVDPAKALKEQQQQAKAAN